jgi:hypothetical protein
MDIIGATESQVLLVGFASTDFDGRRWARHGLQDSAACNLCDQKDETVDHLLANCVVTRELWDKLLQPSGWGNSRPTLTLLCRPGGCAPGMSRRRG